MLLPPKPVVTSWDVFDTLLTRFVPNPNAIFDMVRAHSDTADFVQRRLNAQAALDRIGHPYVLHDIYRQMAADGLPWNQARILLRSEVEIERSLLIPIRTNVARVNSSDLIISDMYLPPELISAFMFDICDLHVHRPIIRSNWGKHTGTLWPLVLNSYVIRRHVGDNPQSDYQMPSSFRIVCELVTDSQFSAWETKLNGFGLWQLALIQREVRLRCMPPRFTRFHEAIVGPYLTLLLCFAMHLVQRFGADAEFTFLSRSADDQARVFGTLFPDIPARTADISRRLTRDARLDPIFAAAITPATVVVDMVTTGRSFFRFAERIGDPGRGFITFAFLDHLLNGDERARVDHLMARDRFHTICRVSDTGLNHWPFEHLLQSYYPPVADVALDQRSGGVLRSYGTSDLDTDEVALIGWKSSVVTELNRAVVRRGIGDPNQAPIVPAMQAAFGDIIAQSDIMIPFSSFSARESTDAV
jgi:hypothetical protein